ncbi:hypothetical protein GJ744_011781 [Endocarpon pusillum]|uniref:Uncharacterized protein n=1 Tax=Endocarpon pusillum TaxID=364733 RepID=A0A8H7E1Y6_9EURO|nr:hypothetical protein GJ744_011781 [Endocarpon pusillum]
MNWRPGRLLFKMHARPTRVVLVTNMWQRSREMADSRDETSPIESTDHGRRNL